MNCSINLLYRKGESIMKKIISCLLALTLLATLFTGVIMATGDESAKAETSDTAKEETKEEAKTEEKTETKTESTGTAAPADGAGETGMVNEDTVNAMLPLSAQERSITQASTRHSLSSARMSPCALCDHRQQPEEDRRDTHFGQGNGLCLAQ